MDPRRVLIRSADPRARLAGPGITAGEDPVMDRFSSHPIGKSLVNTGGGAMRWRRTRAVLVACALVGASAGCAELTEFADSLPSTTTGSGGAPVGAAAPTGAAADALAALPVKGRAPKTGYDRDQFGTRWKDTDRNGCDQRNDVLARDLTGETFRDGSDCVVLTGQLADPYTGTVIAFTRGQDTSDDVQIDHVVALSDAWQKGAQQLDAPTREQLGNDPLNLMATDGPTNQSKGDGDAATWLPPNRQFRCAYVSQQVAVKAKYRLWVTQAERDAIAGVLDGCPGQALPADPPPPVAG
jgi:uncharacterized protein DUF1524